MDEEALFLELVEIRCPEQRMSRLAAATQGNEALRRNLERLLKLHEQTGDILQGPPAAVLPTVLTPGNEAPGALIGPYKLLEQIGEGGFGIVFMAEQQQPVRRKVAIKVLKPGMDTRQVVARFEAERQALALMDHPNIARVLDAGTTDSGRPYFVMELVKGVPITEYCDAHQFTPRERLELFVDVCQAVQHAHQKGIIHRDIKPGNVLVTEHDGSPVVKVIDFGVAKALGQQLTEKTIFTGFAQMIGTPLYMSPEQAALSGLDIDTRSDIYSLGVLLYELLTGTTPFDRERLRSAAFDEIRRIIREEEPPKPSTRLSALSKSGLPYRNAHKVDLATRPGRDRSADTSLASIAALRKMEPRKLSQFIRGDLDWIVMKALEKDRNRRYETANGFALDMQRYLADEAVSACPPSAIYRLRKFARRNRAAFAVAATITTAFLVAVVALAVSNTIVRQEIRKKEIALDEKGRALRAKDEALLQKSEALAEKDDALQTAREAVDRMYTRAAEEMRDKPQVEQIRRALLEDALRYYRGFQKKADNDPAIRYESALAQRRVGEIYALLGEWQQSLENHRQAVATLVSFRAERQDSAAFRDELARTHYHTACALLALMRLDEANAGMDEAIALWAPLAAEFPENPSYLEELARAQFVIGGAWLDNGTPQGIPYSAEGQKLLSCLREKFPDRPVSREIELELKRILARNFTDLPHDSPGLKKLERECRELVAAAEAESLKYPDAPKYEVEFATCLTWLENILAALDRADELESLCRKILQIHARLASANPHVPEYRRKLAGAHFRLAAFLEEHDSPDEALEHFGRAIALAKALADEFPKNAQALDDLAMMLRQAPALQFRNLQRALELAVRAKALGGVQLRSDNVALAQIDLERFGEALTTCKEAHPRGQQDFVTEYVTAVADWHLGRHDKARVHLQEIGNEIRNRPNPYWYAGESRRRLHEAERLMGLKVDETRPSDPEQVLRNSIAYCRRSIETRAGDERLFRHLYEGYVRLCELLRGDDRYQEAIQMMEEAVATFSAATRDKAMPPTCRYMLPAIHQQLGIWNEDRGHLGAAIDHFIAAVQLFGKMADADRQMSSYRLNRAHIIAYRLGLLLEKSGRFAEAETRYREAVEDCKASPSSRYNPHVIWAVARRLTDLLTRQERFDEAELALNRVIETWPGQDEAWLCRADFFMRLGLWHEAGADFSRAFELKEPSASEAFCNQALLRCWIGDAAGYRETCRRMVSRFADSDNNETWHHLVAALVVSREPAVAPSPAVSLAERALASVRSPWRVAHLGIACYRAGEYERAVAALEESQKIDPRWNAVLVNSALAMAEHRRKSVALAAAALGKARSARETRIEAMLHGPVGSWPESVWDIVPAELLYQEACMLVAGAAPSPDARLMVLRARALDALGRTAESRSELQRAYDFEPDNLLLRVCALPPVARSEDFGRELAALRVYLRDHSDQSAGARIALARAYLKWGAQQWNAGHRPEAHEALDLALEITRDDAALWLERGNLWSRINEPSRAIADYSRGLTIATEAKLQVELVRQRASCHARLNHYSQALADWSRAIDLAPEDAESHNAVGWLLATCPETDLRDPQRAVALAERATRLAPAQGVYWNTLGAALYRAGNAPAAIRALNQSMELRSGGDAFDWFFLAMAEWQQRNVEVARKWYDKARVSTEANAGANEELRRLLSEASGLPGLAAPAGDPPR